jgi:hypothetical protein
MKLPKILGAVLAIAAFWVATAAQAATSVRLEWIKGGNVLAAEVISSSGSSTQSSAAPSFSGVAGQVRVSVVSGAAVVSCCAASPTATQSNGIRLEPRFGPITLPTAEGLKVAVIEASNGPSDGSATLSGNVGVKGADGSAIASATNPLPVGGAILNPSATLTRPADTTAYASGDLVANSTTAGSVTPLTLTVANVSGGSFILRSCSLRKSTTSTTNASFRLHLYRSAPTVANGDNGAWSTSGVANYLGAVDITIDRALTDGAIGFGVPLVGAEKSIKLASGTDIRALVEARGAYTPGSAETFTAACEVWPN